MLLQGMKVAGGVGASKRRSKKAEAMYVKRGIRREYRIDRAHQRILGMERRRSAPTEYAPKWDRAHAQTVHYQESGLQRKLD